VATVTRKVSVVGSRTFPLTGPIGAQIVDTLRELGPDALVLTRGAGPFEQFISTVSLALGLRCFQYVGHGRDNWERDTELVADADEVVAFVDPALLDTKSGTAHVIECALAAGKPVKVATVVGDTLVWEGVAA
jgi:hypothetical protein